MNTLNEKDREIIDLFQRLLPKISARDKERLVAFGNGLCFAVDSDPKIIENMAERGDT